MFRLNKSGGLQYYTIDSFSNSGLVRHCFSTRMGGVSGGCYESMNLRINSDDSRENILRNYEILCSAVGINVKDLVCSHQIHEDNIVNVGKGDCGNGLFSENKFESADGLMTDEPEVALVTFFADCVPIFFLDVKKRVIALVHSGWRGTVARIGQKAAEKLKKDYKSVPEDIIAAVGPSICESHYEVSDDVAEIFKKEFGEETVADCGGRLHVNLRKAVKKQLAEAGIKEENITDSGICTYCNHELLFSHRKTGARRGNLAAIMELRKECLT